MKVKDLFLFVLVFCLVFSLKGGIAPGYSYETYEVSAQELVRGYNQVLRVGDSILFEINSTGYQAKVLSIYDEKISISVTGNENQYIAIEDSAKYTYPNVRKFDLDYDDYYDLGIRLIEINYGDETKDRNATIRIEKISEEITNAESDKDDGCTKYYDCPDGKRVEKCGIVKTYDKDGNVIGTGCGCKSNPEELCLTGTEKNKEQTEAHEQTKTKEGGEAKVGECYGCLIEDKCVQFGYRKDGKYCDINNEFKEQKDNEEGCDNNFECSSNVCVDGKCLSGNLINKIINWLKKLFG